MNTVQSIIESLTLLAEQRSVIDPETYIRAAEKINVLLQNEQDLLYFMEQEVAKKRAEIIESGKTAAHAKIVVEATDEYRKARTQKALIDRALEVIRLAKVHSRMATEMARSGM